MVTLYIFLRNEIMTHKTTSIVLKFHPL